RADAALQHRQAEFLDAELAGLEAASTAVLVILVPVALAVAGRAQLDLIDAQLGRRRDVEAVLRAQAASGRLAPGQRLRELLAAAHVGDDQRARLRGRQAEALRRLRADHVLHRHRLARAQQRAVEHGVGHHVGLGLLAGGRVEAPGLDAALPV